MQTFSLNLSGTQTAAQTPNTPSGNVTSTNVQTAINELQTHIDNVGNANPFTQVSLFDEMIYSNPALNVPYGMLCLEGTQNSGGGLSTAANTAVVSGRLGIMGIETGTTQNINGQGFLYSDINVAWCGNGMTLTMYAAVQAPILSDSTNEYVIELGYRNQFAAALSNNAFAFLYKRSTSTNWAAYTGNNGTQTTVTSANASLVVTAGAWYNLKMVVGASAVDFYVAAGGGSSYILLGSSSTNLPDSTHTTFMNHTIYRAATFALRRQVLIDWMKLDAAFTASR